jgi:hypothetical protein
VPAIAAMSKVSMRACRCGYRAHGALLQVETIGESPVGAGHARDCRDVKGLNGEELTGTLCPVKQQNISGRISHRSVRNCRP